MFGISRKTENFGVAAVHGNRVLIRKGMLSEARGNRTPALSEPVRKENRALVPNGRVGNACLNPQNLIPYSYHLFTQKEQQAPEPGGLVISGTGCWNRMGDPALTRNRATIGLVFTRNGHQYGVGELVTPAL